MITPVNGHLLIEPQKHDSFISSAKDSYEEIGIVRGIYDSDQVFQPLCRVGDTVFFDSWTAAKYPTETQGDFFWLVKWEDVRAIKHGEISE